MAIAILVPQVGQDLTEAKVVAIHVKPGDVVAKGDIVAEVESEKATFEVEAFSAGTVLSVAFQVGDWAPVLDPLMHLGSGDEDISPVIPAPVKAAPVAGAGPMATPAAPGGQPATAPGLRSSPLARRLAAQGGVSLAALVGTGPKGAVVMRDVTAALQAKGTGAARVPGFLYGNGVQSLQSGQGTPVVFLHGFGAELAAWRPLVGRVAVQNPMIGVDLAAHGAASAQHVEGFEALVDDTARRLAAAGLTGGHLVGHSLGAAVAVALADRGDLDVRSLTLLAPAGLGPWINGDFLDGYLGASTEDGLARWMDLLVHRSGALPGAMVRATFAARGRVPAQAALAKTLFDGNTQLFSVQAALARLTCTCRVIIGLQDAILRPACADTLGGAVAVHRLSDVGHLPQTEAAALVGRLVAETVRSAG